MTTGLILYKPLLEIRTYNKERYYIPWEIKRDFEAMTESQKFITYDEWGIATASIESWGKPTDNDNILENFLYGKPKSLSKKIREKAKEYLLQFPTKELTEGVLIQMYDKFKS